MECAGPIDDLITTHHSPLTTHHSPLTTHHSPLTIHHSLLAHPRRQHQVLCSRWITHLIRAGLVTDRDVYADRIPPKVRRYGDRKWKTHPSFIDVDQVLR